MSAHALFTILSFYLDIVISGFFPFLFFLPYFSSFLLYFLEDILNFLFQHAIDYFISAIRVLISKSISLFLFLSSIFLFKLVSYFYFMDALSPLSEDVNYIFGWFSSCIISVSSCLLFSVYLFWYVFYD